MALFCHLQGNVWNSWSRKISKQFVKKAVKRIRILWMFTHTWILEAYLETHQLDINCWWFWYKIHAQERYLIIVEDNGKMVHNENRLSGKKLWWYHVGMELSKRKVSGVIPSRLADRTEDPIPITPLFRLRQPHSTPPPPLFSFCPQHSTHSADSNSNILCRISGHRLALIPSLIMPTTDYVLRLEHEKLRCGDGMHKHTWDRPRLSPDREGASNVL